MTDLELIQSKLSELEKLEAAATPGPWANEDHGEIITTVTDDDEGNEPEDLRLFFTNTNGKFGFTQSCANEEFVAASRVAVPSLTAALKKAVEGLEKIGKNFTSEEIEETGRDAEDCDFDGAYEIIVLEARDVISAVAAALGEEKVGPA